MDIKPSTITPTPTITPTITITPTPTSTGTTVYTYQFAACCSGTEFTIYSSSSSIIVGSYLYSDISLTTPFDTFSEYLGESGCPTPYTNGIQTNSSGLVTTISFSGICD